MTDQSSFAQEPTGDSNSEINNIEEANLKDRTGYLVGLDHTLSSLKDFGRQVAGVDMTKSEYSTGLFMVFNGVYQILDDSKLSYGDEFRTVNGLHLWEISAIDASAIGINTVVPKHLEDKDPAVVVKLEDLDDLRLSEFSSIANSTKGDSKKAELVKKVLADMGGVKTTPIFERKKEEKVIYL